MLVLCRAIQKVIKEIRNLKTIQALHDTDSVYGALESYTAGDRPNKRLKYDPQESKDSDVLFKYPAEVTFFRILHAELQKSIRFFNHALDELKIRVDRLSEGSSLFRDLTCAIMKDKWSVLARSAFSVYKDLVLLETYSIMTFCAFSKILKKHDKVTGRSTRNAFMTLMVTTASFNDTTRLHEMLRTCVDCYNEASLHLEQFCRSSLQEDERLFLGMVEQLNNRIMMDADPEILEMEGCLIPPASE